MAPGAGGGSQVALLERGDKGPGAAHQPAFGRIMRELENCAEDSEESLLKELYRLGLDETAG